MNARAVLEQMSADITHDVPVLARGLLPNQLEADDPLWEWAVVATEHVLRITGGDDDRLAQCVEAFVVTSLDFLRLQARFVKTGRYAHQSAAESASLYADAERMVEYLDGLALTYALWPNHTRMVRFYADDFVPRVPHGGRVLEIGPGHGLLASVLLERRPDVEYVGVDISPHSLEYSANAFAAAGIGADRYALVVEDAVTEADGAAQGPFDAAVCCEVFEHVDDPASLVRALVRRLRPSAPAFVSTVANMEAEDHVYLFRDADEIRALLRAGGLEIDSDMPLELAGRGAENPKPVNYSAVARAGAESMRR